MHSNVKEPLFVMHRGNVSGPYSLDQIRSMRKKGTCDGFSKVSSDRASWQSLDSYVAAYDLRAAAPLPVTPPDLQGLLSTGPADRSATSNLLRPFPVFALVLLHYLTLGIFSFFYVTKLHDKLPRIKSDDPSGTKAIALCFVPIYNLYWIFEVYVRLANRLNALSLHYRLPLAVPLPLAYALCVLWLIPGVMAVIGSVILLVLMFSPGSQSEIGILFFAVPSVLTVLNFLFIFPIYAGLAQRGINRAAQVQIALLGA